MRTRRHPARHGWAALCGVLVAGALLTGCASPGSGPTATTAATGTAPATASATAPATDAVTVSPSARPVVVAPAPVAPPLPVTNPEPGAEPNPAAGQEPAAGTLWRIGPNGECDAGQLEFGLESRGMDSGAGNFYWNLVMTNTSTVACSLDGYPSVQLVDAGSGRQLGPPVGHERYPSVAEAAVALPPGASAYSLLHLGNAGAYSCTLVPVTELAVTPPHWDQSRPVPTPNPIQGCDNRTTRIVNAGPFAPAALVY